MQPDVASPSASPSPVAIFTPIRAFIGLRIRGMNPIVGTMNDHVIVREGGGSSTSSTVGVVVVVVVVVFGSGGAELQDSNWC